MAITKEDVQPQAFGWGRGTPGARMAVNNPAAAYGPQDPNSPGRIAQDRNEAEMVGAAAREGFNLRPAEFGGMPTLSPSRGLMQKQTFTAGETAAERASKERIAETQATKEPPSHGLLWQAQAEVERNTLAQQKRTQFTNLIDRMAEGYGGPIPKAGTEAYIPYHEAREYAIEKENPQMAWPRYQENIQIGKAEKDLFTPENLATAGFTAEEMTNLKNSDPIRYRATALALIRHLQTGGGAAGPGANLGAPPAYAAPFGQELAETTRKPFQLGAPLGGAPFLAP